MKPNRIAAPLKYAALFAGLALAIYLIVRNGTDQVLSVLIAAGPALFAVPAFMLLPLVINARAWQLLFQCRPPFRWLVWARWVGQSVNNLLPLAQIGGFVVEAHQLKRRLPHSDEPYATMIVDVTLTVFSLTVFIAVGFALMASRIQHLYLLMPLFIGVGIFVVLIGLFYFLQRHPLPAGISRVLMRPVPKRLRTIFTNEAASTSRVINTIYRRRTAVWSSFALGLLGWFVGAGEVYLTLLILGNPVSPLDALILESVTQAIRNTAFMIPGGLGVQEGGFIFVGQLMSLPAPLMLAVSLTKRFRMLIISIPGLLALNFSESRRLARPSRRS